MMRLSLYRRILWILLFSPALAQAVVTGRYTQIGNSSDSLRHDVENLDTELHMLQEKVNNQETILNSIHTQISDITQGLKSLFKSNISPVESSVKSLESANKVFQADIQQLRTNANETVAVLSQYKQRFIDLEKLVEQQNQNLERMQVAINALMEAVQGRDSPISSSGKSYKVKSGDSLEKIARAHQTTIKALKALNGLSSDKIVVGQILQIP